MASTRVTSNHSSQCSSPAPCPASDSPSTNSRLQAAVKRRLFVSHALSTWNSRVFEFGAVLYLASVFPNTLMPLSIYALIRGVSAVVCSPLIGTYIDATNRLDVVRLSIVIQRLVVSVSCLGFWFLITRRSIPPFWKFGLLAFLSALACVEKLSSIMNLVAVERDWVVVIAEGHEPTLRELNSQMRRIDLICKLAGPFFIAVLDGISTEIAIITNLALNVASILVEYYAIAKVYNTTPALQEPRNGRNASSVTETNSPQITLQRCKSGILAVARQIRAYLTHKAILPSFAGALLYFTVLSFNGQMVTYLLATGYSSLHIGIMRTVSVAFELSATWLTPLLMSRIGPIRTGIWFINWQIACLAFGACIFTTASSPIFSSAGLVGGTILSRIGLWGFDLSSQIIVQEDVEADTRGSFSTLEASAQNFFELCSFVTTIVFSRPDQFQWPVLMSCTAVFMAGGLYATFVRQRRGHLIHFSKCMDLKERRKRLSGFGYARLSQAADV
ncbi:iron-regulated transporter [Lophium mytilinum]|uniref:Solute carrier family 40 member n=1 Tax=Lophium mytilinum TaxID=390894 RepID=A0A6A6R6Y1_9PEZI|nr:iron-regulated transporter [Lophium mytilinum]